MKNKRTLALLCFLLLLTLAVSLLCGSTGLPTWELLWEVRAPRILACFIVGMALALSGYTYQSVLSNILADPYILGLSSGASTGAVLSFHLFPDSALQRQGAFLGGFFSLLLLLFFYRRSGARGGPIAVTLWGITLSLFFTATTVFLLQTLEPGAHYQVSRWFMGSFNDVFWSDLTWPCVMIFFSGLYLLRMHPQLALLSTGALPTLNMGLDYHRSFIAALSTATLLAVAAVMVAGPIGFVGLLAPAIARQLPPLPRSTEDVLARTLFVGPLLLLICDTVARTLLWKYSLPTGALTAVLGAPILAVLLWKQ